MAKQDTFQPTAEQAYKSDRELVLENLATINGLLKKADESQARTPKSWGHVGNLGYVNEQLEEIISFLS